MYLLLGGWVELGGGSFTPPPNFQLVLQVEIVEVEFRCDCVGVDVTARLAI